MRTTRVLIALLLAALMGSATAARPPKGGTPSYTLVTLGHLLNDTGSTAHGANNLGQVVGESTRFGLRRPFVWTDVDGDSISDVGEMVELPRPYSGPENSDSLAYAINNSGEIVGEGRVSPDLADTWALGMNPHALYWDANRQVHNLNDLNGDGVRDRAEWLLYKAVSINDAGQISGTGLQRGTDGIFRQRAFLLNLEGTPLDPADDTIAAVALSLASNHSTGQEVSASGDVVGDSHDPSTGRDQGFLLRSGTTLGLDVTYPAGLNESLEIVGLFYPTGSGFGHAFYKASPSAPPQDLGTLGGYVSRASDINSGQTVVGRSTTTRKSNAPYHAFRWHPGGVMTDLNTLIAAGSGWTLVDARKATDAGHIVGTTTNSATTVAYLLVPR